VAPKYREMSGMFCHFLWTFLCYFNWDFVVLIVRFKQNDSGRFVGCSVQMGQCHWKCVNAWKIKSDWKLIQLEYSVC
jgi:hypothetical protein